MRKVLAVIAALVAPAFASTPALAYDDPAVALCEYVIKAGIHKDHQYKRIDAFIENSTAVVQYTTQALTTAPRKREHRCVFAFSEEYSRFVLHMPADSGPGKCSAEAASVTAWESKALNQGIAPGTESERQYREAKQALRECNVPHLRLSLERARLWEAENLMMETGIYPIAPADTALTAAPATVNSVPTGPTYDRAAAGYVTSSNDPAVLDYVVCLEAATRSMPGKSLPAKMNFAAAICGGKEADFSFGEPTAAALRGMILDCGFRPGDANPDVGC